MYLSEFVSTVVILYKSVLLITNKHDDI